MRVILALGTGSSLIIASISALFMFSGMQMYLPWFITTHIRTILGGYLGSLLFVFILTAIGNLETIIFGKSFQIKLFPEGTTKHILIHFFLINFVLVIFSLFLAVVSSAVVHRVAATTW